MTKKTHERVSFVDRKTNETQIKISVNLDGTGENNIKLC